MFSRVIKSLGWERINRDLRGCKMTTTRTESVGTSASDLPTISNWRAWIYSDLVGFGMRVDGLIAWFYQ